MQSLGEIKFAKKQQNYLPNAQPTPTERYYFYGRAVRNAPAHALFGFTYDGKPPVKVNPEKLHYHGRDKVGLVNRWKYPDLLYADLLGSAQAFRALLPAADLSSIERSRTDTSLMVPRNIYGSEKIHRRAQLLSSSVDSSERRGFPDIHIDKSGKFQSFLNSPPVPVQRDVLDVSHPMEFFKVALFKEREYSKIVASENRHSGGGKKKEKHSLYFLQKAQQSYGQQTPPDVIVDALGYTWNLHQAVLERSGILKQLLNTALAETETVNATKDVDGYEHQNLPIMLKLVLPNDPILTQEGVSVAFGNLYLADRGVTCPTKLLAPVLATAALMDFQLLRDFCERCMVSTFSTSNIVLYLSVAARHNAPHLASAAFNWLALNFVGKMSNDSHLRFIEIQLLEQVLKSDRLFVPSEYALFSALMAWCFTKMNSRVDQLPPGGAILAFFSSLSKETALLERSEGQSFAKLFNTVRFQGITTPEEVYEVQQANILPSGKLVKLLSEQLTSFSEGGDMRMATDLSRHGVRRGFILNERPKVARTESMSLFGFHFTLVATSGNVDLASSNADGVTGEATPSSIAFYIQRRHPQDPTFGAEKAEREVFSLRGERYVLYSISVYNVDSDGSLKNTTTGPLRGKFLIRGTNSRIVRFTPTAFPVYVQFSLVLPSS